MNVGIPESLVENVGILIEFSCFGRVVLDTKQQISVEINKFLLISIEIYCSVSSTTRPKQLNSIKIPVFSTTECEGIPHPMWNTKFVTLYNVEGVLVGQGTCHNLNSELVLGAHRPLEDTHVSVHVSKIHSEVDILGKHVHSLVAWPNTLVHCHGASARS